MHWEDFLKAIQALKLHDTLTAFMVFGIFCFLMAWRLRGWIASVATKMEFKSHREAVYKELLIAKDAIKEDLAGFHVALKDHQADDNRKFEATDERNSSMHREVLTKLEEARMDLSKIKGKLDIPDSPEVPS